MSSLAGTGATVSHLDEATRSLVRLSAVLAAGSEEEVRAGLHETLNRAPHEWIEELLLQTYLFAGFPRALNGMREWRRLVPRSGEDDDGGRVDVRDLEALGERSCALVYGNMYERLRHNIRELHPLLDDWMIVEGYGKVLSRPALDLGRRELCIVAACAATAQDRQLQSHLHGARNVGLAPRVVGDALESLRGVIPDGHLERALRLFDRIRHDVH